MAGNWRTVRVFISSTFRDMHAERDHLVQVVFPRLRERLAPYRVELVDIDLRWGVTREQAENDQALDVCLHWVDECRPFFIGVLGERYGYVPPGDPVTTRSRYGEVQFEAGRSITELEVLFGVLLNDTPMRGRSFFYFRSPDALKDVPEEIKRSTYIETDPVFRTKLATLKERIRASGAPIMEDYPARWNPDLFDRTTKSPGRLDGLDAFGERVCEQLWRAIQIEYALPDTPPVPSGQDEATRLASEVDDHKRFMESRLRVYVGRVELEAALIAYVEGDQPYPCLVTGPPGSGKSSALARLDTIYRRRHRDVLVIPHFIGASPRSAGLRDLLRRLCLRLKDAFGYADDVPHETAALVTSFRDFLARVPVDHRIVILLDALDLLEETDLARELYWLPCELASHVKVVASCVVDPQSPEAEHDPVAGAFSLRPTHRLRVTDLDGAERRTIIRDYPALFAKTLDAAQVRLLLSNPATSNPLYLRVALEELRGFGSFDDLNDRIHAFPRDGVPDAVLIRAGFSPEAMRKAGDPLAAIFVQVIERLETDFDREVVRSVLTLLATARRGLLDRELLELVEAPGVAIEASTSDLFPVLRHLRPYLLNRGGLLGFFHTSLLRAVQRYLLATDDEQGAAHGRLGDYFDGQDDWLESPDASRKPVDPFSPSPRLVNLRKVDELVWQRIEARQWDRLARTLTDLDFLEAKTEGGRVFDLADDFARAFEKMPGEHPARRHFRLLGRAMRHDLHFLVRHPTTLFQCLWNLCWWHDCPEAAAQYDSSEEPAPPPASGPRLSGLLEDWRSAKEAARPRFRWLRSLRPPPTRLDSGLLMVLRGHAGPVPAADFSPDGRRIVSGSWDRTVRVWDADSGYELACLQGHTKRVRSVAFSPDGRRIASGSEDGTVRVWDPKSGQELACFRGHSSTVAGVVYAPDGRRIASGSEDGTVRIWDANSGQELACLREASGSGAPRFSPDGRRIAGGSHGLCLSVWDADSGGELVRSAVPGGIVLCVRFSPDGRQIFTGSNGGRISLWNADSGEEVGGSKGNGQIRGVMLASDCRRAADVFWDGNIRVWKTSSSREFAIFRGAEAIVEGIAFSPDGRRIAAGSWDHAVRVWDADSGGGHSRLRGHTTEIAGIAFSPDGRLVASHSADGSLRAWDAGSGRELACFREDSSEVEIVVFAPDGRWLVFTRSNGTARVWDARSGGEPVTLQGVGPGVTRWVKQLGFTADARRIVGALLDDTVAAWNPETGALLEAHDAPREVSEPAPANAEFPWCARSEPGGDTAIVPASGGPPVAWFPAKLNEFKTAPSGRAWAGNVFKHLYLVRLEGDASSRELYRNG